MKKTFIFASKIITISLICVNICLTNFTMKYISLPDDTILKIIINVFATIGLTVIYFHLICFIVEKLSKD